jgi:acyl dehydratase
MQFGRYFEEFEVGAVYKHWPGRTITEADHTLFCMLTMNHNPLHIDAEYAAGTQFGQRLVAGPLVFSIAVGMSVPDVSGRAIANLAYESVEHIAPTFHGDTIYAETTVLEMRASQSKPDRGVVKVETRACNQRGEEVLRFRRSVLVPRRPAGGEEHDDGR